MIFVDSSAWIALADPTDGNHELARDTARGITTGKYGRMVTSDYVLDETLTLVRKRVGLEEVERLSNSLKASPNVHVNWVGERVFESALRRMLTHQDKVWSFTDCTSFETMQELGIRRAFAFDRDFTSAGFEVVPGLTTKRSRD